MPASTILIVVLIILLVAALPTWPYATGLGWGYWPSGILGLILLVLIIMALMGRL